MDRVMSGYSKTNRIRLPEDKINVDKSSVLGASVFATLLKAIELVTLVTLVMH